MGIQVNTFDTVYFCKESAALADFRAETGVPNTVCAYGEVPDPIAKILFADRDGDNIARLAALLAAHPRANEFDFIRSDRTLYEILPRGIHKGVALSKLAELLHIDPCRTIAVGDYNNDIGMLRTAGLGVAVANATDEVKEAADLITVSNEEHAIARIIKDLQEGQLDGFFPA
jgi:hydroxymethylpyrimidine pyrophosphatase-like HAD family hydrolase